MVCRKVRSPHQQQQKKDVFDERREKPAHQMMLKRLHYQRKTSTTMAEKRQREQDIDRAVRAWNNRCYSTRPYFGLHGSTVVGAEVYVEEIIKLVKEGKERRWRKREVEIQTGRGNNSPGGYSEIKRILLEKYGSSSEYEIEVDRWNSGVLLLRIL